MGPLQGRNQEGTFRGSWIDNCVIPLIGQRNEPFAWDTHTRKRHNVVCMQPGQQSESALDPAVLRDTLSE